MELRNTRKPGDQDLILELHREGYRNLDWRFESDCMQNFLAHVQATMDEAKLENSQLNQLWFAEEDGRTFGCAGLLEKGTRAQLRWVVLLPGSRGRGIGRQIVERAIDCARDRGLEDIFLETTDGLDASMALYKAVGFVVDSSSTEQMWFGEGNLITMVLPLS
ncbi:MAG: GNAT family N-acetyltransferase [Pseudomonadota bacterium]